MIPFLKYAENKRESILKNGRGRKLPKQLYDNLELDKNRTHTFYLISGEIEVDKNIVTKDSFFIYSNVDNIKLICSEESILFHISVPNKLNYETYYK